MKKKKLERLNKKLNTVIERLPSRVVDQTIALENIQFYVEHSDEMSVDGLVQDIKETAIAGLDK